MSAGPRPDPGAVGGPGHRIVQSLDDGHVAVVTDVLCDAFREYPVMRWVLGPPGPAYDRRLPVLVRLFVLARVYRGEPVLSASNGGAPDGAALVTFPDQGPSPAAFDAVRRETWAELGADALERYEAFGAACQRFIPAEPHVHLGMIGVRRAARGTGLARALLERVHAIGRERPPAAGVTLTTENPDNLPFYERFGYRVIGHGRVSPGLESWMLYRRERDVRGGAS